MSSSSDEMQRMAQRVWGALDSLSQSSPEEYQKLVGQAMEEGKEFFTPPQPALCLCTGVRGRKGTKLYINLCEWSRVPAPPTDDSPVPVKGGVLRHLIVDGTRREKELIIDIAFNPAVMEECLGNREMKQMLISLSLDFIDEVSDFVTDRNFQEMRNKFCGDLEDIKYSLDESLGDKLSEDSRLDMRDSLLKSLKGGKKQKTANESSKLPSLFPQQSRQTQQNKNNKSLIEELPPSAAKPPPPPTPNYSMAVKADGGRGGRRCVRVKVQLPALESADSIQLDVSERSICVQANGYPPLTISLPLPVCTDDDLISAKFSKRSHTLTISLPSLC